MIAEKAAESISQAVAYELQNIVRNHGAVYASEHEGYAVLLEEVQEANEAVIAVKNYLALAWTGIRNNNTEQTGSDIGQVREWALALAEEAVQCAAVCERFLETIK